MQTCEATASETDLSVQSAWKTLRQPVAVVQSMGGSSSHMRAGVDAALALAHKLLPHDRRRVQRDARVAEQQEALVARLLERLPQQPSLRDARVGAAPYRLRFRWCTSTRDGRTT